MKKPLRNLRWIIGGVLFLSTVVNYIDRQTLSVLAPYIKLEYEWSNTDFALLIVAFRIAYAIGQTLAGRFLDQVGTRKGLTITVAFYSVSAMLGSLAVGLRTFCVARFLLGFGEAANWPGATKAVSEWFPRKESGWAVALFDSGSSIGAAVAPFLVLFMYHHFGSWRPVFLVTGALGILWLILFRWIFHPAETHPHITSAEKELILANRAGSAPATVGQTLSYRRLLRLPQTWGIMLGKALTDPVWFFVTDWFAIFLVSKNFRLEDSLLAFWVPFLAADVGNFAGGGFSSWLIKRGWAAGRARKFVVVLAGLGMTTLIPAVFTDSLAWIILCFAVSTLSYAALSTMVLNLPADVYPSNSVASVSGLSGTAAGAVTIIATLMIGRVADGSSFAPVLVAGSLVPLVAVAAVLILVRNTAATREGLLNKI